MQILRISGYSGRQIFGGYPSVERLLSICRIGMCLTDSFHTAAYALNFVNFICVC